MIWNKIEDIKPLAYMTGGWDGKKSDRVLVRTQNGKYYVAEMYEGVLDGSKFFDFYDHYGFEISNVTFWAEIEFPSENKNENKSFLMKVINFLDSWIFWFFLAAILSFILLN